ncbi:MULTISPECIES: MBL fold metallo-hydrolase [unclassified Agarivorans]|uniref:MBL fold metallo-hydrolase n=1 Tax=unclassified Agarivorans TaxID=2636026 RepID=UPI003D7D90C3
MSIKNNFMKFIAAGIVAVSSINGAAFAAESALKVQHFPAGEHGFYRAPVLLSGEHDALLIDGGFTYPDGQALVAAINASGKTLTTIYVSQSDPDYYFSLAPIKAAFPDVRVIAASATIEAIKANVKKKLAIWGPQLQANGPQTMDDIVLPEAYDESSLRIESHHLDIVNAEGLANRRYLWEPSSRAILGGVMVFSGVHVWTADTAGAAGREAWINNLNAMLEREPKMVIAGHMSPDAPTDASAIRYTRDYLLAFEEELAKATNSEQLIKAMTKRYPNAGMGVALQIGAKVAMGEMKWG